MRARASLVLTGLLLLAPPRSALAQAPLALFSHATRAVAPAGATPTAPGLRVRLDPAAMASLRKARGGRITLPLPDGNVEIALHPSDVLAPDAVVQTTGPSGPRRFSVDGLVLVGEIPGEAGSIATLTLTPRGVLGVVIRGDQRYSIAPSRVGTSDHAIAVDGTGPRTAFECPSDLLPRTEGPRAPRAGIERTQAPFPSPTRLVCDCAVDCDYEFYANKFGSDSLAAANYVLTVYATISQIYERDLNTTIRITFLNEWTTAADPWNQTTLQDQLNQFTGWCVSNRAAVPRNLAQLVSGRSLGGGVAWLHAICSVQKGYAVIQWDATYSYPTANTTWDVEATAHELGHNFGSEHTQSCYWEATGFVPAGGLLDTCFTAEGPCYSGPTGIVPSVKGTVMSYCHLVFPGMSNIRLGFHEACKRVMRDEAEVSCLAAAAVQPPRRLVATTLPSGNALQWLPSLSSGVLRYRIYRSSVQLDHTASVLDSTTSTVYVDPVPGAWYYKVKAVRASDASGFSNESRASACAPTNPTTQAVGAGPVAALSGRFNDDLLGDLAVVNGDGASVSILIGQRLTPSYSPFGLAVNTAVGTHPVAIAAGDFQRDGTLDLAVAIGDSNTVTTLRGSTAGTFTKTGSWPVGNPPRAVAVGDVDEDGIQDLLVACGAASRLSVLRGLGSAGTGDGTFAGPVQTVAGPGPARGIATGDWNTDGILDVAITDSASVAVLLGQGASGHGNGAFGAATSFAAGAGAQGIATGDFNEDGATDLAVACPAAGTVAVLLGNGSGGFAAAVSYGVSGGPASIVAGDWNQDGIEDLATANGAGTSIGLLFGNGSGGVGNGTFASTAYGSVGSAPRSILSFEFDDDGRPDLGIVNGTVSGLVSEIPVSCAGPYLATLDVTAPSTNLTWIAPSEHAITWTRDPAVPEVNIELSRDGGLTWQTLATHLTGTSWTWTVSEPYTNQGKIRVSDSAIPARMDTTVGLLTIVPQNLVGAGGAASTALAIHRIVPTPSRGDLTVWLSAPDAEPARLELIDVAGRRVRSMTVPGRASGPQPVSLLRGAALPGGIYVVRLTQRGRAVTAKAVVVR